MYSRIGCCIEFFDLSHQQKNLIIDKWYIEIINSLNKEEKEFINKTSILNWFKNNSNRYDNIRLLKTKLENAIYNKLTDEFVLKKIDK